MFNKKIKSSAFISIPLVVLLGAALIVGSYFTYGQFAKKGGGGGGEGKGKIKVTMECNDGIDNDGDGYCDFLPARGKTPKCRDNSIPGDPDCISEEDNSECQINQEVCDNIDNDCDGAIDEDLSQQCGISDVGTCQYGTRTCTAGIWNDCSGNIDPIEEVCDGADNNCDGIGDNESCKGICDTDQDSHYSPWCFWLNPSDDCNDNDPNIYPGATETCDNKDNNCNGVVDENACDATLPIISSIQVVDVTETTATIYWTTNEESNSVVEYGLSTSYGLSVSSTTNVTSHQLNLSGLIGETTYNYIVKSTDSSGNQAQSSNQTFTTSSTPPTSEYLLYRFDPSETRSYFGYAIAAGDVNGDGKDDVIVGAHSTKQGSTFPATYLGSVFVYSGTSGTQLYRFDSDAPSATNRNSFGYSVAAGDVNSDGKDDIVIGAVSADPNGINDAGSVYVYSGANGSELYRFDGEAASKLGAEVVTGDVNGDGVVDVIAAGLEHVVVYSGADGSELHRLNFSQYWPHIGAADVNKDGKQDVIVSVTNYNSPQGSTCTGSMAYSSTVFVYSGADFSLLRQINSPRSGEGFGKSVASAGDVDGDGNDDIIVGAHTAEWAGCESGSAYIFSGATGAQLRRLDGGAAYDLFGVSVSGAGDVNNDGKADVIVGAIFTDIGGANEIGSAYVYSGANGSELYRFDGEAARDNFGKRVLGNGDINGDGYSDVVVSTIYADPNDIAPLSEPVGSVYIYSLR